MKREFIVINIDLFKIKLKLLKCIKTATLSFLMNTICLQTFDTVCEVEIKQFGLNYWTTQRTTVEHSHRQQTVSSSTWPNICNNVIIASLPKREPTRSSLCVSLCLCEDHTPRKERRPFHSDWTFVSDSPSHSFCFISYSMSLIHFQQTFQWGQAL